MTTPTDKAISYPFLLAPGGSIQLTSSYEALVRAQVIDALMTNQGERVMRPNYGCDIQAALFDPTDELVRRDAAAMIRDRLQTLVPRCVVKSADIEIDPLQPQIVYVSLVYRPSLYATDELLKVPVSEFVARERRMAQQEAEEVN